jgi:RNA polymerase-binding transcription factor DksA
MFSRELHCPACGWRTVCGLADAISRLRLVGSLRREKEPDEAVVAELLVDAAPQMTCTVCKSRGLSVGTVEVKDDADWQAAILCEICRQPIPPERLEFMPETRRCVACQGAAESGQLDEEPEFCPKCGALVELRVSHGAGITRYKRFCTGYPPCRL